MNRSLAKVIAVAALRSSAELNALIPLLKMHCPDDEYEDVKSAIADLSLQISDGLLRRAFHDHPDLEQELDDHFQQFGRPA